MSQINVLEPGFINFLLSAELSNERREQILTGLGKPKLRYLWFQIRKKGRSGKGQAFNSGINMVPVIMSRIQDIIRERENI